MNTPSKAVEKFLQAWKDHRWNDMAEVCQLSWKAERKNPVDVLKVLYEFVTLHEFSVGGSRVVGMDDDVAPKVMADVSTYLRVTFAYDKEKEHLPTIGYFTIRTVCETAPYQPSVSGTWGVNPSSVRRAETEPGIGDRV